MSRKKELLIHIADAAVRVSFAGSSDCVEEHVPFAQKHAPDELLAQTVGILRKALKKFVAREKHAVSPARVRVLLSAPWYASQTRTITYAHPKRTTITRKLVDDLLHNEHKKFMSDMESHAFLDARDTVIILARPVGAMVDGAPVADPALCRGTTCAIDLYIAVAPRQAIETCAAIIAEYFPSVAHAQANLLFEPFSFFAWKTLPPSAVHADSYTIFDIGAEITDLTIVTAGVLAGHASFPFGKNAFLRSVARATRTEGDHARSLCRLYQRDALLPREKEKIDHALLDTEKMWRTRAHDAADLLGNMAVPPTMIVVAEDDCAPWFEHLLTSGRHQLVQAYGDVRTVHINPSQLFEHAILEE